MKNALVCLALLWIGPIAARAQTTPPADNAICTFADGKQLTVRYTGLPATKPLDEGKVWPPPEAPMFLFTEIPVHIGQTTIPVGAFSLHAIPGKREWTLIVNSDVSQGAHYDEHHDIVRHAMEVATTPSARQHFRVDLGRIRPSTCEIRLTYNKTVAWAEVSRP